LGGFAAPIGCAWGCHYGRLSLSVSLVGLLVKSRVLMELFGEMGSCVVVGYYQKACGIQRIVGALVQNTSLPTLYQFLEAPCSIELDVRTMLIVVP
jgi:hypothetical protein